MQLYNTMTRSKEEFTPLDDNHVRMYACGITAYDYCHIGHARSAVVFDVLVRYLRHVGYNVTFARNFTDVDDKIINRANENGEDPHALAERFIGAFHEDMDRLNVTRADIEPRATEFIEEMIALTQKLIDMGHAYSTESGDVYFRVRSFNDYGKLSGRDVDDMRSGARIQPGDEKEDPLDFALWKAAKPGEPKWKSPWGEGRPGWHIECSAMSDKQLSLPFDIHGGGQDLIFPHHENEIAQSEAASGKDMARFWVHNGFVQVNSEKMSKSLGNFSTIRDILDSYQAETLRYFLLTKHYRSPIDFTPENMLDAEKNLKRIYSAKQDAQLALERAKWSKAELPAELVEELKKLEADWNQAMADDINTAAALGHVFGLIRLMGRVAENKSWKKSEGAQKLWTKGLELLSSWGEVLGVFQQDSADFLAELKATRVKRQDIDLSKVEELLAQRLEARKAKDFERSDAVRDELAALGIAVKDSPAGQEWDVL
ncbi:cysteine--tRNA ligase [Desulfobaculum bizertense]|uniref:Cysteine--tRNA ligase n=1 Tax=Desulfobaculum bizertense DSM 18034 TaxID=1121442 RepID=A0A1T4W657_9BACT|nr:cysteine--tRNA ligase [Desulfobaculum bizertense]UIJ39005.1 cysteine--tRNA ligase [Desulfobaculum bizertense]SKA72723.1 cysteinyl-tRNA synthetase [Desulfobaculum bizertense DSM 18034]